MSSDDSTGVDSTENRINPDEVVQEGNQEEEVKNEERPGNAQFLETPSVIVPVDFSGLSYDILFGKRREVYRLRASKLNELIDC